MSSWVDMRPSCQALWDTEPSSHRRTEEVRTLREVPSSPGRVGPGTKPYRLLHNCPRGAQYFFGGSQIGNPRRGFFQVSGKIVGFSLKELCFCKYNKFKAKRNLSTEMWPSSLVNTIVLYILGWPKKFIWVFHLLEKLRQILQNC